MQSNYIKTFKIVDAYSNEKCANLGEVSKLVSYRNFLRLLTKFRSTADQYRLN